MFEEYVLALNLLLPMVFKHLQQKTIHDEKAYQKYLLNFIRIQAQDHFYDLVCILFIANEINKNKSNDEMIAEIFQLNTKYSYLLDFIFNNTDLITLPSLTDHEKIEKQAKDYFDDLDTADAQTFKKIMYKNINDKLRESQDNNIGKIKDSKQEEKKGDLDLIDENTMFYIPAVTKNKEKNAEIFSDRAQCLAKNLPKLKEKLIQCLNYYGKLQRKYLETHKSGFIKTFMHLTGLDVPAHSHYVGQLLIQIENLKINKNNTLQQNIAVFKELEIMINSAKNYLSFAGSQRLRTKLEKAFEENDKLPNGTIVCRNVFQITHDLVIILEQQLEDKFANKVSFFPYN